MKLNMEPDTPEKYCRQPFAAGGRLRWKLQVYKYTSVQVYKCTCFWLTEMDHDTIHHYC